MIRVESQVVTTARWSHRDRPLSTQTISIMVLSQAPFPALKGGSDAMEERALHWTTSMFFLNTGPRLDRTEARVMTSAEG